MIDEPTDDTTVHLHRYRWPTYGREQSAVPLCPTLTRRWCERPRVTTCMYNMSRTPSWKSWCDQVVFCPRKTDSHAVERESPMQESHKGVHLTLFNRGWLCWRLGPGCLTGCFIMLGDHSAAPATTVLPFYGGGFSLFLDLGDAVSPADPRPKRILFFLMILISSLTAGKWWCIGTFPDICKFWMNMAISERWKQTDYWNLMI